MKLKKPLLFIVALSVFSILFNSAKAEEFDVKSYLDNVHVRIGVAYKTQETKLWFDGVQMRKALTARIGAWYRFEKLVFTNCYGDLGIDHHSQYTENKPFNKRGEYAKTEVFADYTCTIGGIL